MNKQEPFFITYANHTLLDHPERIRVILDSMKQEISLDSFGEGLSNAYDVLAEFYIEAEKKAKDQFVTNYLLFMRQPPSKQLRKLLKGSEEWFKRYDDGTCKIVRDQIDFRQVLSEISQGLEYDGIEGFGPLLKVSENVMRLSINIKPAPPKSPFKKVLTERIAWDGTMAFSLPLFLQCFSSYILLEFLLHENRERLKYCEFCNKFFIAKNTKRKICYDSQCFREYKRIQKQCQREADPVKYV